MLILLYEYIKLTAYDEDKFEFVNKQVQIFNNNCFVPKTTLLLKVIKFNQYLKLILKIL